MAGIEEAFEKFVKKISDTEEESENKNLKFGRDVYAPEEGLFFQPVQKNQSSFAERLRSDPRLSPPLPNMRERDLTPEERIRLGDNQYFMSQDRPEYASPVVQGQGFNKRDVKDFAREYIQTQTPLGGGIGYQGPEYGVMAIKPFVGPDRSALLQAYYNTDNEGSRIQAMLSPKEQQIGYTGNTGTTFSAGRNTFQGSPYYTLNLSKSFADGGVASMFRERPEYSLGGPTKAIRKISPETPMEEPFPSGLAIKSIRPTQQAIDDFVNMPVAMGQMIGPDALPNEDYVTYVRRKRAETGPPLFAGEPITMPVLPSTPTPQVDVSANPVARALEMAGFTREEIMRILGQQGFADGGIASMFRERPGYQVGGTINPLLALQRSPIDQYGYSDPVISALTGNIFTSGQRFRDVFNPQAGLMMQQAQAAGYSEPEMEELRQQQDFFPSFQRSLNEAYFGPTFQADPQKSAIDLATSIYNQRFQAPPSVQQQRPQTQYQYSSKGTPILQYGYTGTPSAELQSQIDLQKRALDRLESIYNKPMANIGGDERVHAFGNTGGYKYNQNELLQNILRSEQEAAARVTPTRMSYGGRVSMSDGGLTNTIPPAKGPDSQGVESLFRRRYN